MFVFAYMTKRDDGPASVRPMGKSLEGVLLKVAAELTQATAALREEAGRLLGRG
jgi:hypothetical protein